MAEKKGEKMLQTFFEDSLEEMLPTTDGEMFIALAALTVAKSIVENVKKTAFENGQVPGRKNANGNHICMTTNEGMMWIYETIIKYGNDKEKATAYADRLVFGNDIHQLTNVFDILYKKDD